LFGANDAAEKQAENNQHVPLDEYKRNLKQIVTYLQDSAPGARIILVAPSPVEHQLWITDQGWGRKSVSRRAGVVKSYADTVCEIGKEIGIPVLNLLADFMSKVAFDASANGPIPGSLRSPPDESRTPFVRHWIQDILPKADGTDSATVA
jgi:lysophospholipase L1-like esterase